ncbi:hypothetical protein GLYMA_04G111832v4 [Glycine max]|nr:hypothetical protein GLYMA_04G111832v4 [Glycine max]KAH1110877.1 hypothetical protein GYH30_009604 [Glycine max]
MKVNLFLFIFAAKLSSCAHIARNAIKVSDHYWFPCLDSKGWRR